MSFLSYVGVASFLVYGVHIGAYRGHNPSIHVEVLTNCSQFTGYFIGNRKHCERPLSDCLIVSASIHSYHSLITPGPRTLESAQSLQLLSTMPKSHSKKASKHRAPDSLNDEEATAIVVSLLQLFSSGERHDYVNETCRLIHVPGTFFAHDLALFGLTVQADYKTRSGMKLCNSDFSAISSRLNAVAFSIQRRIQMFSYGADELPGLDVLLGNIVTIYAGLAEDALLRSRIFAEARQSCPLCFISTEHFTDTPAIGA